MAQGDDVGKEPTDHKPSRPGGVEIRLRLFPGLRLSILLHSVEFQRI